MCHPIVLWQAFQQNGLNQENKSGMKLLTACPICKSEQIGPYAMKYEKDFPHNSRTICKSCGIVFANPVADEQELNAFYKNYYDKGNFGDLQYKQKTIQQFNSIQSSSKDGLLSIDKNIKYYSGNGCFLDVGFGLGVHLYMAQKLGYKVYGTELDSDCINFVAPYLPNAQLFNGDLLSANYENNYFMTNKNIKEIKNIIINYLMDKHLVNRDSNLLKVDEYKVEKNENDQEVFIQVRSLEQYKIVKENSSFNVMYEDKEICEIADDNDIYMLPKIMYDEYFEEEDKYVDMVKNICVSELGALNRYNNKNNRLDRNNSNTSKNC